MINNYIANLISILNYSIITKRNYCKIIYTKLGERIISLLFVNGYITYYRFIKDSRKLYIYIFLKYNSMFNPIFQLKLISKPGNNVYWTYKRLCNESVSANSITTYIISTSQGIITDSAAMEYGVGGKVLFKLN